MNMEIVKEITSIAKKIYSLVEKVKANKKRSQRVGLRVKALDDLVRSIKKEQSGRCKEVKKCLTELSCTLTTAKELIQSYTEATWVKRLVKVGSHKDEFNCVNDRLTDAFQNLSGALQVEQSIVQHRVFELVSRMKEDEEDRAEDEAELKTRLLEYMQEQQRDMEILKNNVEKILHGMAQPSITDQQIRNIKHHELKYDDVKKPFMVTANTEVYKGEFNGFPVAIKRYVDPLNISQSELQKIFDKEVETMRRFESPNILRMFGICVQSGPGTSPRFLIIMEYCEKGSLRDVLDSDWAALSWPTRARMCRDAARGLYRLHQTEEKSKVHGCLNSNKFLVAEGYTVKLGGFELAKTETSLRKTRRKESISSLCYTSPEMLNDVNLNYSKESEIYSIGIVMWEIASGRRPFDGWSNKEINNKVCNEKFKEELPSDCPEELARLIDDCRDYDQFCRPSAGVLVDKLPSVVAQIDRP
uniref:Mixed lineage kinase domain like pseudokinase n=1 Tax=Gasterosteus aculeatus aculeatus TaxID=481459 RepID=G3P111_GASAC|nr:mixed lineage kinase domain-like protein [Gasterosteus aculeatus aculeatus]XP_040018984.1 mixed lineage kinase domain-like protein [Gasterosteus aculeatus aculeatus]